MSPVATRRALTVALGRTEPLLSVTRPRISVETVWAWRAVISAIGSRILRSIRTPSEFCTYDTTVLRGLQCGAFLKDKRRDESSLVSTRHAGVRAPRCV